MKKLLILSLIVFLCPWFYGQTVLKVVTSDKMTGDLLQHVAVTVTAAGERQQRFTGRNGVSYFTVNRKDTVTLKCEHIRYGTEVEVFFPGELRRDTLKIEVAMRFEKITNIGTVEIHPDGVPDTVFGSKRISVDDFEFLPDGRLLLLTYARNKRRGTELYLYDGFDIQSAIPVGDKEQGQELIRDFRGNPHVITEKHVYGITAQGNEVFIGALEKDYFMKYIAPIVDTTVTKYFFSNYNPDYPAFDYFTYDLYDSSYRKIAAVEDELMMELYRSEYKWVDVRTKLWAKDMEHQTGIDAEVWVGATYFTQSVYYKELYAPLFRKNDTLVLFDHYKSLMFRYDAYGNIVDSLPIFYHLQPKQTGWKKQLIQDQLTGQIYCLFEKAGQYSLQRFDITTGETKEVIYLSYRYPENITVRGNFVYYIYREFETAQKKYLYREKLPFDFPKVSLFSGDQVTIEAD